MKNPKNLWVWIGLGIIIALLVFINIRGFVEEPQDLGSELEYFGTTTYGCWFICDSPPNSTYYFATNLTQEELKEYFKGATYVEYPNRGGGGSGSYNFEDLYFLSKGKQEEFPINYYDNTKTVIELKKLNQTNRQFVISIAASDYQIIKASLE